MGNTTPHTILLGYIRGMKLKKPLATLTSSRKPSVYAQEATQVFRKGVKGELADLARKGIETVARVNGGLVRGVPRKVARGFVLEKGQSALASSRGRRLQAR